MFPQLWWFVHHRVIKNIHLFSKLLEIFSFMYSWVFSWLISTVPARKSYTLGLFLGHFLREEFEELPLKLFNIPYCIWVDRIISTPLPLLLHLSPRLRAWRTQPALSFFAFGGRVHRDNALTCINIKNKKSRCYVAQRMILLFKTDNFCFKDLAGTCCSPYLPVSLVLTLAWLKRKAYPTSRLSLPMTLGLSLWRFLWHIALTSPVPVSVTEAWALWSVDKLSETYHGDLSNMSIL